MNANPSSNRIDFPTSRIPAVNVAAVPQRSPLRYPGGKTWLIPHVRHWLERTSPKILIEPFAGGGIVSLTAIMEDLVEQAIMIEIDHDVAAFWHTALRDGLTLGNQIQEYKPTREDLCKLERSSPRDIKEHAFRTLVMNRTRRGGILAPGASFCRAGENGKGVLSRWYPETLAARLAAINEHSDKILFYEGDGTRLLDSLLYGRGRRAAVFLDPPYTANGGKRAGSRLYTHSNVDHAALFGTLSRRKTNFMMTYDHAPEIVDLVHQYDFHAVNVRMKNTHHNYLPELVITPDPLFS